MFCQYIHPCVHLWMHVVPAADLWSAAQVNDHERNARYVAAVEAAVAAAGPGARVPAAGGQTATTLPHPPSLPSAGAAIRTKRGNVSKTWQSSRRRL